MRTGRASSLRLALLGATAGAAGTTALNTATYLDMAGRGRPASSTPEDTVEALSDKAHIRVPDGAKTHDNRLPGLGPLTGIAAGVGVGVGVGALLGAARACGWRPGAAVGTVAATVSALLRSSGPTTLLGVTDPWTWPASSWVADLVPHLAYGAVTAVALDRFDV